MPSNSERRQSRISSTAAPLHVSSTHGATSTDAVEMVPPYCVSTCSEYELMTSAMSVATTAPHPKANTSCWTGSASSRSSQSRAGSTMQTGTSAKKKPATKPVGPVSLPTISASSSRQASIVVTASTSTSTRRRLARAVRRGGIGGTAEAAAGTWVQPALGELICDRLGADG